MPHWLRPRFPIVIYEKNVKKNIRFLDLIPHPINAIFKVYISDGGKIVDK